MSFFDGLLGVGKDLGFGALEATGTLIDGAQQGLGTLAKNLGSKETLTFGNLIKAGELGVKIDGAIQQKKIANEALKLSRLNEQRNAKAFDFQQQDRNRLRNLHF